MHETGIYDLSQFYDTNVLVQSFKDKTMSSHTNSEKTVLNHLKPQKPNQSNIIFTHLKLQHFQLAIKFWVFGFCFSLICLTSEILIFHKTQIAVILSV